MSCVTKQHRLVQARLEPQELVLQMLAHHRVHGAEGLVHQQHRRIGGQRPGHPDPLPLASAELLGVAVAEHVRVQAHQVQQFAGALPLRALDQPSRCGTVAVLSSTVRCGEEPGLLDDVAHPAAQLDRFDAGDVGAVDQDAPLGRFDQPVDHLHGGGLAAARGPDEGDQFPVGHLEGEPLDRDGPVGVALGHVLEANHLPILVSGPFPAVAPAAAVVCGQRNTARRQSSRQPC